MKNINEVFISTTAGGMSYKNKTLIEKLRSSPEVIISEMRGGDLKKLFSELNKENQVNATYMGASIVNV